MHKHRLRIFVPLLILNSILWAQTEKNAIDAYLLAPALKIIESKTLIPETVARRELQQNDPASYRIFAMLFKENILHFDDLLDVISLNLPDEPKITLSRLT